MSSLFDPTIQAAAQAAPVAQPVRLSPVLGDDAWFDASSALAPSAPVVVEGMVRSFHPWQAAAYEFAVASIARWGGAMLGDDMGMGKTQVLFALAADAVRTTGRPAIMAAPVVALGGYISDLAASFPHLRLAQVGGHKRVAVPDADIYFISDDTRVLKTWLLDGVPDPVTGKVSHHVPSVWAQTAGFISLDEIHRYKGRDGKPGNGRSMVALTLGDYARRVGIPFVGATGTLLSNRPVEAYNPLMAIGGEPLLRAITPGASSIKGFLWRYCAPVQGVAKGGRKYTSFKGLDLTEAKNLHRYLRSTVYCRREKRDLGEGVLPEFWWQVKPLALPDHDMARYQKIEKDFYNTVMEEKGKAAADRAASAEAIVQMMMLWAAAGEAKAEAAAEYIADLVEAGEQVVAFYVHTSVFSKVELALAVRGIAGEDIAVINGKVRGQDRVNEIEAFQAGDAKVCLAQIESAGMAVTLTAAPHAVFIQVPWSAGAVAQAAGRILRTDGISMARAANGERITYHVLQAHYADGDPSFDAAMWHVLSTKAQVCDAVNAGREVTMPDEDVFYEALMAWQPNGRRHLGW